MSNTIYFSRFGFNENGNGGNHRAVQLCKAFESMDLDLVTTEIESPSDFVTPPISTLKRIKRRITILNRIGDTVYSIGENVKLKKMYWKYGSWQPEYHGNIDMLRGISKKWANSLDEVDKIKLAFVEDPIYFLPLVKKLKALKVPVVALCQNLESLSDGQAKEVRQRNLFNNELDILSICDLVVTISAEEYFILNNLGINATYFPYFPVAAIEKRLLEIRESRKNTEKSDILLLGTASNAPTKKGMLKIINTWKECGLRQSVSRLVVAGYSTEQFNDLADDDVLVLGSLSADDLNERLTTIKACLCYQDKASGALTRISEMLVAGIPVLANTQAARSYHNLRGLIEFQTVDDIEKAFKEIDLVEGSIPIPPKPETSYLLSKVADLID